MTRRKLESAFYTSPSICLWEEVEIPEKLKPAAVLIPIFEREKELFLILTRRTDHLHHHPGQISFPGGRVDKSDKTPVDTALREAEEEIGLPVDKTRIIGSLPSHPTITGFFISPVIGLVESEIDYKLDQFEVAELLEVPLKTALDLSLYREQSIFYQGEERKFWELIYREHRIWGATAAILRMLSSKVGTL